MQELDTNTKSVKQEPHCVSCSEDCYPPRGGTSWARSWRVRPVSRRRCFIVVQYDPSYMTLVRDKGGLGEPQVGVAKPKLTSLAP